MCEEVGIEQEEYILDKNTTTEDIVKLIEKLKDEYAITLAKSYFQGMKKIGLGKADSIKYLEGIDE